MIEVEASTLSQHRSQDPGVLVGLSQDRLLPAHAGDQLDQPMGELVAAIVGGHDTGFGAWDELGALAHVAAFGDTPTAGFSATGFLAGHQTKLAAELGAGLERGEVA